MTTLSPEAPRALSVWFSSVIEAGRRMVADLGGKRRDLGPLLMLFWTWMSRKMRRFEQLAERAALGLPPPAKRPSRTRKQPTPEPQAAPPTPPTLRLPRRNGWLLHLFPGVGLGITGTRLYHRITTDPELQALIEAVPELGRVLRPVLRAFGADPIPLLALPQRPRPPRIRKPRPERPRRERRLTDAALRRLIAPPPDMPDPLGVRFERRRKS